MKILLLALLLLPSNVGAISMNVAASSVAATVLVTNGGTGNTAVPGNGGLFIGNAAGNMSTGTLTGTTNELAVTNAAGSITLDLPSTVVTTQIITRGSMTVEGAGLSVTYSVNAASIVTTGQNITQGSSTVQGNAFSVGASTFVVSNGTTSVRGPYFEVSGSSTFLTSPYTYTRGRTDGAAALAGYIGEIISANYSAGGVGATGNNVDVATITLTAGVWMVFGNLIMDYGGTTAATTLYSCITTTSNGCDTSDAGNRNLKSATVVASTTDGLPTGPRIMNVTANTSVYLDGALSYTTLGGAAWSANSYLRAIRIR